MVDKVQGFPAPVYRDTVLAPLYEGMKRHHWRHLMRINYAHGVMLAERGLLTRSEAAAILSTLRQIEADIAARLDTMRYTGEHEDFFFEVDAELRRRLGIDIGGKLHMARSRNDIDHTLFRLSLKEKLSELLGALLSLAGGLLKVARAHSDTIIIAYTHGQPAQPTTFGHYLTAFVEILLRDAERLLLAHDQLDASSMGAAAITTTGFPIDRERVASLLGFARVQENAYGCIAASDAYAGAYAALQVLALNLGRFVQDLAMRTSFEVGHLIVPDAFVQVSSIMPQKRNPVAIEHLRLLSSLAAGRAGAILTALHNTPFADMNDSEGEVQGAGYEAFDSALRALNLLDGLVRVIEVDGARVRRHIDESGVCMTELADSLVRREGLSFRQAHEIAGRLARHIVENRITVSALPFTVFADVFAAVVGRPSRLGEAELRGFLTPEHFIAVRTIHGGPAPGPLGAALDRYEAALARHAASLSERNARVARAGEDLDRAVENTIALATAA
jgi:argininosuccinate lyase